MHFCAFQEMRNTENYFVASPNSFPTSNHLPAENFANKTLQKLSTSKLGMCIMMTIKLGKSREHRQNHKEGLQ